MFKITLIGSLIIASMLGYQQKELKMQDNAPGEPTIIVTTKEPITANNYEINRNTVKKDSINNQLAKKEFITFKTYPASLYK